MGRLQLFAQPWWVNLLVFVPIGGYWSWRKTGLLLSWSQLGFLTVWGAAFGFVEAAVVVYLRAIIGVPLGYEATFSGIARLSMSIDSRMTDALPKDLLALEGFREAATIVMLLSLAMLAQKAWKERSACFLWAFATWDICYYLGLWVAVRWPAALTTSDVLFLIPVPWISQVWFPVLLSGLTMLAVAASRPRARFDPLLDSDCRTSNERSIVV